MEPYFYLEGNKAIATPHGGGPWDPRMLHGGAPTGLITHLVEQIPTDVPMRITRLNIDLKRPVPIGELETSVTVTREGRNIQTSDVSLFANGKEVARASALKIRVEENDLPEGVALPDQTFRRLDTPTEFNHDVGFNEGVTMVGSDGWPPSARNAVWFHINRPFLAHAETTPMMRAAATGDYCNGIGSVLDFEAWTYINADLTLHFVRQPVGEWIMLAANSWIGPDGRGLAFGELADEQGFFGRSVQSLVVAPR